MIQQLSIDRFKSIRSLRIQCRKVNLFIGAPDTGKTNILEALYLLSRLGWGLPIDASLRVRPELGLDPLFYRQFFDQPFQILLNMDRPVAGSATEIVLRASIGGLNRALEGNISPWGSSFTLAYGSGFQLQALDWIRHYTYASSEVWQYNTNFYQGLKLVTVPVGYNLLYIVRHNEKVYGFMKEIVSNLNWKLRFDQSQKTFRMSEVRKDEIIDYNLDLLSDSLKRLLFYGAILLSSENAALVFDEPDVFAFPPYPKTLGEMIAGDASNQFFVTTHNPYFLSAIAEKTPLDNLAIFVCSRDEEGATTANLLTPEQISRLIELGASVFFSLDEFLAQ